MIAANPNDGLPEFAPLLTEWGDDLRVLRQNTLLNESHLINFARKRGIRVSGVVKGDPGEFYRRGWLRRDGEDGEGAPLFHPFRTYPLHRVLEACELRITPSSTIWRDTMPDFVENVLSYLPSIESIGADAIGWNRIADLAILLEPVYWPKVSGRQSRPGLIREYEFRDLHNRYQKKVSELVSTLDPERWRSVHESLRVDAARLDDNGALYLLLRLAPWSKRDRLRGTISCALWLRHIAEVVRRAFEEAFGIQWLEEDHAFGLWVTGARTRAYGSDRPLDRPLESRPYLASEFGLFTGSIVRWYVEGETEYYAICEVIPDAAKVGIELVNLKGNIEADRNNAAMKLSDALKQDKTLRRLSMISFDLDVPANVRAVRRQVEQNNVVGLIVAQGPDFEFANFTIDELVEIAARLDEADGASGDEVRKGDWSAVVSGRTFEERYKDLSARQPRSLKGEEWGAAMARYALDHPNRSDDGTERPFLSAIRQALRGRAVSYDYQQDNFHIDPQTFGLIERPK